MRRVDPRHGHGSQYGRVLLNAGAKGKRFALPNAKVMIHQPLGGAQGQATEIEIAAREILKTRAKLNEMLVKHTGQPRSHRRDTERDYYMTSDEACEYGIIDKVITSR